MYLKLIIDVVKCYFPIKNTNHRQYKAAFYRGLQFLNNLRDVKVNF